MDESKGSALWRLAEAVTWCVGLAVVVRRFLAPWTLWLARRAACWCRYRRRATAAAATWTPTCRCCDGVDFDGMAGSWADAAASWAAVDLIKNDTNSMLQCAAAVAVVTGCTDGIGKEYALQLADRGINIVLVSRNMDRLRAVAREIYKRHAGTVQTRVVAADFTSSCGSVSLGDAYDTVRRSLAGLRDVTLLINNAGLSYARPERLLDLPPCCSGTPTTNGDPCRDVVECNVLAAVAMCRIVMPLMMKIADEPDRDSNDKDSKDSETYKNDSLPLSQSTQLLPPPSSSRARGGVVINMSSASARLPSPLLAVYAATKAFLEKFSEELAVEYGGEIDGESRPETPRIAVRCLTPGFVATKMTRIKAGTTGRVGWTSVPGPDDYARHSLRSLACHCSCGTAAARRPRQVDRKDYGSTRSDDERVDDGADDAGWLAGAFAAAFDSPSSPFSAGRPGVTTAGYTTHTLMMKAVNLARWMVGDDYVSQAVGRMMCRNRDRMACREAKDAVKNAVPLTS